MSIPWQPGEPRVTILALLSLAITGTGTAWVLSSFREFTAMQVAIGGLPAVVGIGAITSACLTGLGSPVSPYGYRRPIRLTVSCGIAGWFAGMMWSAAIGLGLLCAALGVALGLELRARIADGASRGRRHQPAADQPSGVPSKA
jgi:hypothetical protein